MPTAKRPKRKAEPAALRAAPIQERAKQTRDRLLDIAGELLGEVGIERISTNMIAARAGVSPAALYRYFKDKYGVLEALGRRLMDRQNALLFAWLDTHKAGGLDALGAHTAELLRGTAEITDNEPGGVWILRALRAVPQLSHVRVESHREVTDAMLEVYAPLLPKVNKRRLWQRLRMTVEYGYAIDEMLHEEDRIPREDVLREAAAMLGNVQLEDE
ncbi:MAG: TetR family transcriptional regulator [Alphaproteobacteria bacterium 32-64-14]|nr:MAG: TetR family transcriptional regulator [Alphaproteobacteria bacterium 32-64-14]